MDIDNNKLMGLLIIAGGGLLLSPEYKKTKEKTMTMGASLDKKDWQTIGRPLTDHWQTIGRPLAAIPILLFYLNKN